MVILLCNGFQNIHAFTKLNHLTKPSVVGLFLDVSFFPLLSLLCQECLMVKLADKLDYKRVVSLQRKCQSSQYVKVKFEAILRKSQIMVNPILSNLVQALLYYLRRTNAES
jgi:hypothetical protein